MAKKYVHLSPKTNKMEDCEGPDRCRWRNQNVPHAEAGDTDRIVSIMANAHSNGDMFGTASTNNKDKDSEALARVKKIRKDRGVSTPHRRAPGRRTGPQRRLQSQFPANQYRLPVLHRHL